MAVLDPTEIFYTQFEPKVKNRYILYIDGIPSFLTNKVDPPKFQDPAKEIHYINSYFNIRGKRKWQTASITLYDAITPSGAQAVMDWARLGYETVTGRAGYQDWYKKDIALDIVGPVGDIISEWIYKGAFVSDFSGDQLDWSADDPVNLTIQVTYDYAVLNY